jgi:hypothetical protein
LLGDSAQPVDYEDDQKHQEYLIEVLTSLMKEGWPSKNIVWFLTDNKKTNKVPIRIKDALPFYAGGN